MTPLAVLPGYGCGFRPAGRLLARAELMAAAELCAFRRAIDDLADESEDPAAARESFLRLVAALRGEGCHSLADAFASSARRGMPREPAVLPAATVLDDVGPVRAADEAALLRHAHGAAGTVGLMMCAALGVAIRHLPPRVRPAIRAAARLYGAIGRHLLPLGLDRLAARQRCVVPPSRRLVLAGVCLRPDPASATHDRALHLPLQGLPDAHA